MTELPKTIRSFLRAMPVVASGLLACGCALNAPYATAPMGGGPVEAASAEVPGWSEGNGQVTWISDAGDGTVFEQGAVPLVGDRGYLRQGPVFLGQESAAESPKTATERALELKEENARLSAEMTTLKQQVAQIESELKATRASLEESTEERKSMQKELAATRAEIAQWKRELNHLSELIRQQERAHLESLDELIAAIERLVDHHREPVLALTDRRAEAGSSSPSSELKK